MENTLLMLLMICLRAVRIIIDDYIVVIMVMLASGGTMASNGMRRDGMNGRSVIPVDFMRVRLHGTGRAGPHKRGSQDGRKELTHDDHG